jgi:histidinol-phosphate aminotransferase
MSIPVSHEGVARIEAYVPGQSKAGGKPPRFKLSSNETPFGPSPHAVEAYRKAGERLDLYPDGAATILRQAISEVYNLDVQRIVCGNGSDDLLHLLAQAYLSRGDEAIFTRHAFLVYRIATLAAGGVPVVVEERDLTADVDAILAAVTERTKLVFLANPNNPTGTYLSETELRHLHKGLPPKALLVVDGAYAEYVDLPDYESGLNLAAEFDNVVTTRTFSKIHGLAGLRIGWAYGPQHVIDTLNRIRGPFNVSSPSIAAGSAAMRDTVWRDKAVQHNTVWLDRLSNSLRQKGLKVTPSVANFILVHFPLDKEATADKADAFLQEKGIIVRRMEAYGLPGALRITIGSTEANEAVIEAITEFLNARFFLI